jgi:hypothetical protein
VSDGAGLEGFLAICSTPGARTVPIKIRPCEECGDAATEAWPLHVPALQQQLKGRTLMLGFFCDEHGVQFRRMLQAKLEAMRG